MRREWAWLLGAVLLGTPVAAEDPEDARKEDPRRPIRVLGHPYEIASFYRSSQASPFAAFASYRVQPRTQASRYPIAGFYRQGGTSSPYEIASFYRQGQTGRWGGFWSSESHGLRTQLTLRPVVTADLCFAAPTVL